MFEIILLAVIAWLLWNIREDVQQLSFRQRDLATTLDRLAQRIEKAEQAPAQPAPASKAATEAPIVNLNTASKTQLQTLPKIGGVSADNIVAARPFTSVEQLADVAGINKAVFEDLKNRVTV